MAPFPPEWFHGSPLRLAVLTAGSTITPVYDLARVFSHKPSLVSIDEVGGELRLEHNGLQAGWLYRVLDVREEDVHPHPTSSMPEGLEWLTCRDLALELIGAVEIRPEEFLSDETVMRLKKRAGEGR
jgi:hypothetical protein